MSDVSSFWDADAIHADWEIAAGALASGNDLQTAVIISLFTDRLARADDDYEGNDRRGWWGDTGEEQAMGSRLWLLRREKLTPRVAVRAEEYALEALSWLKTDGVVGDIQVEAQIIWPTRLNLIVRLSSPDGDGQQEIKFYWVWEQLKNAV